MLQVDPGGAEFHTRFPKEKFQAFVPRLEIPEPQTYQAPSQETLPGNKAAGASWVCGKCFKFDKPSV